ncbi:MAG: ATP synthase F1 subunit epsilon [Planctomycetaceae bacterium]|nr:ATP synthase F1 subunit epsilon [Planctomycetaceae bacterium]
MHCIVVTPDKTVLEQEANFVAFPLYDGEYGVLQGHSPMVGRLGAGELRIKTPSGTTESYFVNGGFVEVLDDEISLLTTFACPTSEIDPVEVQREIDAILSKPATTAEHAKLREETLADCRAQLRLAKRA